MRAKEVNRRIERLGGVMTRQVGSHRRYVVSYTAESGERATAATTVASTQVISRLGRYEQSSGISSPRWGRDG
jgi:predicted RNA binding protein YcfA (HicA-like mRNA interferase family)